MNTLRAVGAAAAAVLVLTADGLEKPQPALITGEFLRLQTEGDASQMQNLAPGQPVVWDIGVWADAPDPGEIRLGISGRGELAELDDALAVSVDVCSMQWVDDTCPAGAATLLSEESLDDLAETEGSRFLATMPDDEERWLRVTATLNASAPHRDVSGAQGSVLIHAEGAGEELSTGPGPGSGSDSGPSLGPDGGGPGGGRDGPSEASPDEAAGRSSDGEGPLARTGAAGVISLLLAGATLLGSGVVMILRRPRRST